MIFSKNIQTPVGIMLLSEENGALVGVSLGKIAGAESPATPLLLSAQQQIEAYFAGVRRQFDLPVRLQGTDFQQAVWQALMQIPYGETRTYGEIAAQIGCPRASRAVGMACHKNPILLLVPCHRVIGADGKLTGFGAGLPVKERLLMLEGAKLTSNAAK